MLFFKKKEEIVETWADRKTHELIEEIIDANLRLRETVPNVIVKRDVIDIYPNGADKDKAIADCEKAKYSMLCAIGRYDSAIAEYKRHLANTKDERNTTAGYVCNYCSSHEIIENIYKNFYKRG
jgi:hypothetical protein